VKNETQLLRTATAGISWLVPKENNETQRNLEGVDIQLGRLCRLDIQYSEMDGVYVDI